MEIYKAFSLGFVFLVFGLTSLLPTSMAQLLLQSENTVLFQLQQQLEFPPVLQGWNNWTDFCYLPANPSLVIQCSGNHVTELTIIGNKTYSPQSGSHFSTSPHTLSASFSMDSFFTTLTKLTSLRSLTLSQLGLWGPLPSKIDRLYSVEVLNLSSNSIYGGIPSTISSLKNITNLDLSYNLLNGSVPDLKGLQNLGYINLGNNHLGPNYPSLGVNLVSIILKNNSFRVGFSTNLISFPYLQTLDVSSNKLVGPVPSSLFSLPSLHYLNLAQNQLSGAIPSNISCSAKLGFVNLANNFLIGKLPYCLGANSGNRSVDSWGNCLLNVSSTNFQHPTSFCQKDALAVIPTNKSQGQSTVKLGLVLGIIGGIVGVAIVLGLLIFFIFRRREANNGNEYKSESFAFDKRSVRGSSMVESRRRPQTMRTAALGLPPYNIFSLEEIEDATNNFDAANLVGEGSEEGQLYKGRLNDGFFVMVKCLKLKQKYSSQTLQQHMEVISKLRHRHLASILGHCIVTYTDHPNTASTIFVVLEYVQNGSLKDHLLDWKKRDVLKWPHRMGITMGIARGIQFLHSGIQQGIYGNDLKIENILLDESLTAKISSYNISLPSKVGSESPLHGQDTTKLSRSEADAEKDDIYQFGIILLEMITGKPINFMGEVAGLKNQLEICVAEAPAKLREETDPSIRGTFAYESLKTTAQIAINCLNSDPSKRPSIEDVLWNMQYSVQVQDGWSTSGNLSGNQSTKL